MSKIITGVQQAGVGVHCVEDAAAYYGQLLGFDVVVFDDTSEATLMSKYTNNCVEKRRALLLMNMQGGGGLELWQFLERKPIDAYELNPGDLGIYALKIKCRNAVSAHHFFQHQNVNISAIDKNAAGENYFWLIDRYNNHFQIVEKKEFFATGKHVCAGVCGAVIGVNGGEAAKKFYGQLLQNPQCVYSNQPITIDGHTHYTSTLLRKTAATCGAFSKLLGSADVELLVNPAINAKNIYAGRCWGDPGFIHLCFDVLDMDALKNGMQKSGYQFTVDSLEYFGMENSGGRFAYIEDVHGTLIEMVETQKVAIVKKWNWYKKFSNGINQKPLPNIMIKMMGLNKFKASKVQ